jgi:hypothetical protein
MTDKNPDKIYRDGVPLGRNTLQEIKSLREKLSPELRTRFLNQAIWDAWCRLHKETVYWGA